MVIQVYLLTYKLANLRNVRIETGPRLGARNNDQPDRVRIYTLKSKVKL